MAADNRGPELAAVTGMLLGLSAVAVFLRCYVRIFMLKLFRLEDWLAVWTLVRHNSHHVNSLDTNSDRGYLSLTPLLLC